MSRSTGSSASIGVQAAGSAKTSGEAGWWPKGVTHIMGGCLPWWGTASNHRLQELAAECTGLHRSKETLLILARRWMLSMRFRDAACNLRRLVLAMRRTGIP
ncbi:MAG: hypothetical protein ACKN94_11935 [Pirellulaceae bacterium]